MVDTLIRSKDGQYLIAYTLFASPGSQFEDDAIDTDLLEDGKQGRILIFSISSKLSAPVVELLYAVNFADSQFYKEGPTRNF